MQVECGLRLFCMPKIKHKHTNYFKQYLGAATCPINLHNFNNMKIQEITTLKPLTPQQQRIASLKQQKDNVSKQLKAERERQKIAKAQQTIANVKFG